MILKNLAKIDKIMNESPPITTPAIEEVKTDAPSISTSVPRLNEEEFKEINQNQKFISIQPSFTSDRSHGFMEPKQNHL